MTEAKPESRLRELGPLLRLGVPVALAHLANYSMQIVDTAFVGPLGPEALGGISIASAIYSTVMIFALGLLLGLDFLVSSSFGAGNQEEGNRYGIQALYVASIVAIPFSAILYLSSEWYDLLGIPHAVALQAGSYMKTLAWSLWPWLLFTACRQYLQASGVAVPILITLLLATGVNALGNWVFIYGHWGSPSLGIAGSGLATLAARIFMLTAIGGYLLWRDKKLKLGFAQTSRRFSLSISRKLVGLGLPAGLQVLLEVGVFATATLVAGRLGTQPLAAHQVVLQIASFTFMIPLGLSSAAAVRVATALGAKDRNRALHAGWTSIWAGGAFMGLSGLTIYISGNRLLGLFTKDSEVIRIGTLLLLIAAVFQVFDGIQVVGAGVLRGLGNTRASLLANFIGHWILGLPIGIILCFKTGLGVYGIWIGLCSGLISVALGLTWAIRAQSPAL